MTERATDSAFPLFPALPPELRNQIWCEALPDDVKPALFFPKNGLWGLRHLTEADWDYNPDWDEANWNFDWNHKLLDKVQYEVPLVFVNREARSIALD
jgi:hypothetical protein